MIERDEQREWRWPNHIVMSPTSLNTFSQCHYRIKLQYLQNIKAPEKWVRAFAMGTAAHAALGTIAQQMKVGTTPIGEEQIRTLALMRLPLGEYPSEMARDADVNLVVRWVKLGQRWLKSLDIQEFLLIENGERRPVKLFPSQAEYKLVSRPDLIVRRSNGDGDFIHIIDWKTGQRYPNEDVPVIMRYVTRDKLQEWTGDASAANVLFTWNWLDLGEIDDFDASVETCNRAWPNIVDQMEAMASETEWKATPGWHCKYCPYYQNYCSEEIPKTQGDYYE